MSELRSPTDPDVIRLTNGLVTYLRELVGRSVEQVRDSIDGNPHVWLDDYRDVAHPLGSPVLLEMTFTAIGPAPRPPAGLDGWLSGSWEDFQASEPMLIQAPADEPTSPPAKVVQAYRGWLSRWQDWAREARNTETGRGRYQALEQMARTAGQLSDTHELVLGVGLLAAHRDGRWVIRRHLLVSEVSIVVDPSTDTLRVELPLETPVQREDRHFLTTVTGFNRDRGASHHLDKALTGLHVLSPELTGWFDGWRRHCWTDSLAVDTTWRAAPDAADCDTVRLLMAPAIILRPRDRSGLAAFYDQISEGLRQPGTPAPLGLAQLVLALEPAERLRWLTDTTKATQTGVGVDPLLPLLSNDDQRKVLETLRTDTAVVVQGPPGTGKTHTIANLICALLADGQRVLVTSQKSQALRVLQVKLPPAVRDLCVLMTGMVSGGLDELDRSITALSDIQASTDINRLLRDIERQRTQRAELQEHARRVTADLLVVREQEYALHPVGAAPYSGTLLQMVRAVQAGQVRHGWIGEPPASASGVSPLTDDEALTLLRLLRTATPQRAARTDQLLPEVDAVPSVDGVTVACARVADLEAQLGHDHDSAEPLLDLDPQIFAEITRHVDQTADALAECGLPDLIGDWDQQDWRLPIVEAQLGRRSPAYWATLFSDAGSVERHEQALAAYAGKDIDVLAEPGAGVYPARLLGQARRLRAYLSHGGRVRRFLPSQEQSDATELLESCTVDGVAPRTLSDLAAVIAYLHADAAVTGALQGWSRVGVTIAAGSLRGRVAQLKDIYSSASAINTVITARDAVERILRRHHVRYSIRTAAQWDVTVRVIRAAPAIAQARQARTFLDDTARRTLAFAGRPGAAPEVAQLSAALRDRDVDAYAAAHGRLIQAREDQRNEHHCERLVRRLDAQHPELLSALRSTPEDPQWQSRLAGLEAAWSWANAVAYHQVMRQIDGAEEHEKTLGQTQERLRRVTEELAGKQALLHCLNRITETQRKALQSYKQQMGKYGKGFSRHKERHLAAIRNAMREAQGAVPAWVMPLSVVADTIPPDQNAFDVVIVDEASQASLDALFLLWLAPRIIVVGDDKQCAPGRRHDLDDAQQMVDHHLADLPLHVRNGFDPTSNLYELLSTHFPRVVRLSEHFRCMPEIIGWSSELFYDRRLIPLRQFGADRLDPLKVVHVDGAVTEGQNATLRNRAEADAIIDQVQKIVDDPQYRGKTIGIIALQGSGQHTLLDRKLRERIDAAVQNRFDIRVGQPPDFQGDERDVILLSMVVTKARHPLTNRAEQRRFNVAASRARDQLWLFTSLNAADMKQTDLRYSLLTYMTSPPPALVTDPHLDDITREDLHQPFESLLEQCVYLDLRRRGYAVIAQQPVGSRCIDLVVVGDNGRLGIECETPDVTMTAEEIKESLHRERELRRAGWRILRIRHSEYQHDRHAALEPLWQQLRHLGIEPRSLAPAPRQPVRWTPTPLSDDEGDS